MLTNVRFLASTIQDEMYFQGNVGFAWVMDYGSSSLEENGLHVVRTEGWGGRDCHKWPCLRIQRRLGRRVRSWGFFLTSNADRGVVLFVALLASGG